MPVQKQTAVDLIEVMSTVVRRGRVASHRLNESIGSIPAGCSGSYSYGLLAKLEQSGDIRLTELAALLEAELSVVSRQVGALERDGLVERLPDPRDRRASYLRITHAGAEALRQLRADRVEWLQEAMSEWSEEDARTFVDLFDRLWTDLSDATGNFTHRPMRGKATTQAAARNELSIST